MTITDTWELTEGQKEDFIAGWKKAGGYIGDLDTEKPWCAPWTYDEAVLVYDGDYYNAGAEYWLQVEPNVLRQIKNGMARSLEEIQKEASEVLSLADLEDRLDPESSGAWTESQKNDFIAGWKAGCHKECPEFPDPDAPKLYAPWTYGVTPAVVDGDYVKAGAAYRANLKEEDLMLCAVFVQSWMLKTQIKKICDKIEETLEAQRLQ